MSSACKTRELSPVFQEHISTQDLSKLQNVIKRFQQNQHQEMLTLFDSHSKPIVTSQPEFQLSSLNFIVDQALTGKTLEIMKESMSLELCSTCSFMFWCRLFIIL